MKKAALIILVLVMILSSTTAIFADSCNNGKFRPPGLAKKGGLPLSIAKKFIDIDGYSWAQEAIERMAEKGVIKGIGEGKFAPQRSVTKLEAIVMALRVMGEEEAAIDYQGQIKNGKVKFKLKDYLQEWAYGYVKLAEEKGILDEADMIYFKLNDPASRHEVAKYIVRAMGSEEKAERYMDAKLDYKDAAFIPQGSVGYIHVANEGKLITGYPDGTFRPFNEVTRAEMAVMVARLEGKVEGDKDDEDEISIYRGKVTDIDTVGTNRSIELDDKKVYILTDDTKVVFDNDVKGTIKDIKIGDTVKITVNKDNRAVEIVIERKLENTRYNGIVTSLGINKFVMFALDYADKIVEFNLEKDFEIDFKDGKGKIDDLREGHSIKVIIENSKVKQVIADNDRDTSVLYGRLDNIYKEEKQILVYINSSYKTYSLDKDVEIFLNVKAVSLEDLKKDDMLVIDLDSSNEVITLNAYR